MAHPDIAAPRDTPGPSEDDYPPAEATSTWRYRPSARQLQHRINQALAALDATDPRDAHLIAVLTGRDTP